MTDHKMSERIKFMFVLWFFEELPTIDHWFSFIETLLDGILKKVFLLCNKNQKF
jgi:hypothetical protein